MQPRPSVAVLARAEAARQLIGAGAIDPALGLSYTVWPSPRLLGATPSRAAQSELRRRALELVAGGMTQKQAADVVGVSERTVGRAAREARGQAG